MWREASPLVSVVIPTYNRCNLVQRTIDSALRQTYPVLEVIVVDDGSQDDTREILRKRYGSHIVYLWQENQGESAARNQGTSIARGKYIALLDSDDLWKPDKLKYQVDALECHPDATMVWCGSQFIDLDGRLIDDSMLGSDLRPEDYSLHALLVENRVYGGGSTCLIRSSALQKIGGFDSNIRFGEDWDLWIRLRTLGEFLFIPEPLAFIRVHSNTQCHLPRPEHIARKLSDHVLLLEKAFSNYTGADHDVLRGESLGRQYAEAGFSSYAWGRWEQGTSWIKKALELDFPTWSNEQRIWDMLLRHRMAVLEVEEHLTLERLRDYVQTAQHHLPKSIRLSQERRRELLGQLCAESGYRAYLAGDKIRARRFMWAALKEDKQLWLNRGLLYRLINTLV
jgi:glycosyltransferase involved in cell wall biosynthesis